MCSCFFHFPSAGTNKEERLTALGFNYSPVYLAAAPVGARDLDIGESDEDQKKLENRNEKRLKDALKVVSLLDEYDLQRPVESERQRLGDSEIAHPWGPPHIPHL